MKCAKLGFTAVRVAALLCLLTGACNRSSSPPPADLPPRLTGDPNLDYWTFINRQLQFLSQMRQSASPDKDFASSLNTSLTTRMMLRASIEGVDSELVAWSMKAAKWNAEYSVWQGLMADVHAETVAEKSRPGTGGNPPYRPWLAARMGNELIADDGVIREEGHRLQETLSQRFGKTFPPCSF